jgi:hypothetical protein
MVPKTGSYTYVGASQNQYLASSESLADKYKSSTPPLSELIMQHESIPVNLNGKLTTLTKTKQPQPLINKLAINTILHLKTIDLFPTSLGESSLRRNLRIFKAFESKHNVATYIADIESKLRNLGTTTPVSDKGEMVLLEVLARNPTVSAATTDYNQISKLRDEHTADIRRYRETISDLQKKLDSSYISSDARDLRDCKDRNHELSRQITDLNSRISQLSRTAVPSSELSMLQSECNNAKKQLADNNNLIQNLLSQQDRMQNELRQAESNLVKCKSDLSDCEQNVEICLNVHQ